MYFKHFQKQISHFKRLKYQKNTLRTELGVIHDKEESKNPRVAAAIVVLRLIILDYGRFVPQYWDLQGIVQSL